MQKYNNDILAQGVTVYSSDGLGAITDWSIKQQRFSADLLHISADMSVPYATCRFCLSESLVFSLIRHVFLMVKDKLRPAWYSIHQNLQS